MTKVTALETATTGIMCNAICPGWVLTPLVQKQIDALSAMAHPPDAEPVIPAITLAAEWEEIPDEIRHRLH